MTYFVYAYRHQYLDILVMLSGELKLIASTPAFQGYAITEVQLLFHGDSEICFALIHVNDNKLMN